MGDLGPPAPYGVASAVVVVERLTGVDGDEREIVEAGVTAAAGS